MTFTAMRPFLGLVKGREVSLWSVAQASSLMVVGHLEVGGHPGVEDGDAPEFAELGGVGFVVEGTGDENVEVGVASLPGGGDEVGSGDGAEFRADEDGSVLLGKGVGKGSARASPT